MMVWYSISVEFIEFYWIKLDLTKVKKPKANFPKKNKETYSPNISSLKLTIFKLFGMR